MTCCRDGLRGSGGALMAGSIVVPLDVGLYITLAAEIVWERASGTAVTAALGVIAAVGT